MSERPSALDERVERSSAPVVEMRGIEKGFSGTPVLRGVDITLAPGEVHALAGGNGAGKSTLMKILQGVYRKDAGVIRVGGREQDFSSTADAEAAESRVFSLNTRLKCVKGGLGSNLQSKDGALSSRTGNSSATHVLALAAGT